jgi:C-terminal binding-module, SLH-like, of glucodextranase
MVAKLWKTRVLAAGLTGLTGLLTAGGLAAQEVSFKDPTGDDKGPGTYTYPTDTVYKTGSFDLTGLDVKAKGNKVDFTTTFNSTLEDPWRMGTGFSVQMVFIFIDTDGKEGSGATEGLPGLNVRFAPTDAWERVVILSPQGSSRVKSEVETKGGAAKASIVVPSRVKASGRAITATVDLEALGGGDPSQWGYQVVVQSNEGFPAATDLLTRKVNEYEGQHRFGGGTDSDCDPHAIDILAGAGTGDAAETQAQYDMLKYECGPDGAAKTPATLKMVRKK